jgi:hypothetical protein
MSVGALTFVVMEYITWINNLRAWGISSARPDSKAALAWFFVWTAVKWLLIVCGIAAAFVFYLMFAIIFAAIKGR